MEKSPLEILFYPDSKYFFLKALECLCYPSLCPYNNHKLQPRSTICTFIGYSNIHNGYKCFSFDNRLYISRHVLFHETLFSYAHQSSSKSNISKPNSSKNLMLLSPSHILFLLLIQDILHVLHFIHAHL